MKFVLIAFAAAFFSGCQSSHTENPIIKRCSPEKLCGVPFYFALANPQLIHNQKIALHGYARKYFGGIAIFPSEETALHSDDSSSIWIELDKQSPGEVTEYLNSWVTVTGYFVDKRSTKGLSWAQVQKATIGPSSVWSDSPPPKPTQDQIN
jgi:hypothetical protein